LKYYLLRHAHCTDGPDMDPDRTLTPLGEEQCKAVRKFLKDLGVEFDLVLSSPFMRAVDTAELVTKDLPDAMLPQLEPIGTPEEAWKAIRKAAKDHGVKDDPDHPPRILIVTHSPLIRKLLAAICFAFDPGFNIFSHASMALVNTNHLEPIEGDKAMTGLRWFLTPKVMQQLREGAANEAVADGAIELTENLRRASRAKVIDPLVKSLKGSVARRFRKQAAAIKAAGLDNWRSALHIRDVKLDAMYGRVTQNAYTAGALLAQAQLPKPREAKAKPTLTNLPGPSRDAQELEDELDDTTQKELGDTISKSYAGDLTHAAVLGLVASQFKEWANGERSEMIATNEVSEAYHGGAADFVSDWRGGNGPVLKRWECEDDPCEECQANADMELIDSEAPFDDGSDQPPSHPNCRCSISYEPDPDFTGGGE
jgi:phosphohistidine phosphatase